MYPKLSVSVLALGLIAAGAGGVQAGERDPAHNAALHYWRALIYMPHSAHGTQWEVARYSPLTASLRDAEFLFEGSGIDVVAGRALDNLRGGATMPYCEWALPIAESGPETILQHTQRAGTAVGLLLLHARLEYSRGNVDAAVDDLNAAWVFLRHLSHDRIVISRLSHFAHIERHVAPLAAAWIPEIEERALRRLQQSLAQLPKPLPLSETIRQERDMWLPWMRKSADRQGVAHVTDYLVRSARALEAQKRAETGLSAALENGLTSKDALFAMIDETERLYDEAAWIASLPASEFESAASQFYEQAASANPIARLTLRTSDLDLAKRPIVILRQLDDKADARLAMFRAAIALRLEGRTAFDEVQDPFGDGPFQIEETDGGYTLTSKRTIEGKPFSMRLGRGAAPEPEENAQLLVYDPMSDAEVEIDEALALARTENKRVLLQWGFNGCIPCYALHRLFDENHQLSELLDDAFVHLPVDVTSKANEALIERYRVEMPGVPHLTVLNPDGTVLANVKPSEFYVNRKLDAGQLLEFLKHCADQPAIAEK